MENILGNIDPKTIDELYRMWKSNPNSVDEGWQKFFLGFDLAISGSYSAQDCIADSEFKVIKLIEAYRMRGHLFTKTNPVRTRRSYSPTLDIENFGLGTKDLDNRFKAGELIGLPNATLSEIIERLNRIYCRSIGVEYMYLREPKLVDWIQSRVEGTQNHTQFSPDQQKHILYHLTAAVGFEQFIHRKFVGQKRFSLEGLEALIPALDTTIEHGAEHGVKEFVIGMAHRGRLNVITNIMRKPYEEIFAEFIGEAYDDESTLGDVKYHLGYSNTIETDKGKMVRLHLVPNPSHLETVGPVAEGIARARIDDAYQGDVNSLIPIIIHGDAAVAAQGVVYETIQMSRLSGYSTGGTIHIVLNNQVGFTTNYIDARSSTYSTDVAKVTLSPVFHVNADDPEALLHVIRLAVEFRQTFHRDVFIDLLGYRKYGHNEGDEPRFTQPVLYDLIAKHPNVRDIYTSKLVETKVISVEDAATIRKNYDTMLEERFVLAQANPKIRIGRFIPEKSSSYRYSSSNDFEKSPDTGVSKEMLNMVSNALLELPSGIDFFKKLVKIIDERRENYTQQKVDWAMAELLAYGTLIAEGHPVRLSGQDSERGTFSHRHSVYSIQGSEEKYYPLQNIPNTRAKFSVYNSLLSEYGVLGFEYGYSVALPNGLTIWEAQFGDFHNVAQVIIDQYISSAEDKWGLQSGLVLLLPHGFEGQGPEHSSARIERFLTLSARNNMQIVNATTPANFFHVLRRQLKRDFRTPLVVFTPKSILRHPKNISTLQELESGSFLEVIDDSNVDEKAVSRVVFCSGKIYYDLLQRKEELDVKDIALVRIEQLYPFPSRQVEKILDRYPNAKKWLWVQEEPQNMGAWNFVKDRITGVPLEVISRAPSGSPAVGLSKIHNLEQKEIITKVFRPCTCELKNKYCGLQCEEGSRRFDRLNQYEYFERK
ncbi:MAG TPA: 2-oxoglutarate dehydrogenase E1 component [Tenuifilum sp.]|nr:2-oxoglutarate dehydrogenase E1 component [Tenuifilum sp.]